MKRLNEEQQSLAEEGERRAEVIANRYAQVFPEHAEDLLSAATWGAVRAASTYNPDMNGVWDRWSDLCISGEIKDLLDNSYYKHRRLWTEEALEHVGSDRSEIEVSRIDAALSFDRLIEMLPVKHKELCLLVYKGGMTAAEAGVELGYTPNHGDKLHREAIGILRDQLAA